MITSIVQARLTSSRLSHKVLLPFNGHTVLEEVLLQIEKSKYSGFTVVTFPETDKKISKVLWPYMGTKIQMREWDGDENDIIGRYYDAAKNYYSGGFGTIVRITSDCPLILPEVIDLVIKEHFLYDCEYTYNRCDDSENGWPDGLDVEVFSFRLLQKAYILAEEREHMTWLRENGTVHAVKPDKYYGPCTSINTKEDYELALKILGERQNGGTHKRC